MKNQSSIMKTLKELFLYIEILFFAFIFFSNASTAVPLRKKSDVNYRPIIGILSQEISYRLNVTYPGMYKSYIAASYIKFVESAGARVIPIRIGEPESYYEDIMSKINGVLYPGGSAYFNRSNGYADAGDKIYRIAERLNRKGDYFPVWGTCLGFELMTYLAANRTEHRIHCSSHNQPLPLEFTKGYKTSKIFGKAPKNVIKTLKKQNSTANYHGYCTTEESLAQVNLQNTFRILSFNHDKNNVKYISTIEHVELPFYGVQFHPEKNMFEWVTGKNIPHSPDSIDASQYFGKFFVNEARKSQHHFSDKNEENELLIYNYSPAFTGAEGSAFEQSYLFQ